MGRLQSSVGLITGTDILGTVDQLIAVSARPRDRLVGRTEQLQQKQSAINSLTALVVGVQLSGNRLGTPSLFQRRSATSSDSDAVSVTAGERVAEGDYSVRTLAKAATHSVTSRRRFAAVDQPLGLEGTLTVNPSGFLDSSAVLSNLNGGRGVEGGLIRITDRSGASAEIDLTDAQTIEDVLRTINDADVDVRATTTGDAIRLIDQTGLSVENLQVEQLGDAETAADLGLWGIDQASSTATGVGIELPDGVTELNGVALSELGGGSGLGNLGTLNINLSDGSNASINLSSASTTTEVIDLIEEAGLDLIVGLNEARNGFRIRDVSGGDNNLQISGGAASKLGLAADTSDRIVVGENLLRQTVTADTKLADLNGGAGVGTGGFTITDSNDATSAINLKVDDIETVGQLVDAINDLAVEVTASINDAGDGIAIVDNGGGEGTLTIKDNKGQTTATSLGIAGEATEQTVAGDTVSALVGTQADVIEVTAEDTLSSIAAKISEGRYGDATLRLEDDGTYSLAVRGKEGGLAGQLAINTDGFDLDLDTTSIGQDAKIAVTDSSGVNRLLTSSDGVFELTQTSVSDQVTLATPLSQLNAASGSFTIQDSSGKTAAINTAVDQLETVGDLVEKINSLDIGVEATINESGDGLQITDTAGGSEDLIVTDIGDGLVAANVGIAGTGETQTINEVEVLAITGSAAGEDVEDSDGLVFTLKELSDQPITVTVQHDTSAFVNAAKTFVNQYNSLVDELGTLTFFDSEANEVGLLFGTSEALRIDTGYGRLLSGQFRGAGEIRSLGEVGISLNEDGKLDLDEGKLNDAYDERPEAVVDFFTTEDTGVADRLNAFAERLAGADESLLVSKTLSLSTQIDRNNQKVDYYNGRLESERERLLKQFFATEEAIAKLQNNLGAIEQIQPIQVPA